jgi:hypothetical protein
VQTKSIFKNFIKKEPWEKKLIIASKTEPYLHIFEDKRIIAKTAQ